MCLSQSSIPVEGNHNHGSSYKGKHFFGTGLQFRGLVHYQHGVRPGGPQADMVQEKELGVPHPDQFYMSPSRQQEE